jgi:hypothetical protein
MNDGRSCLYYYPCKPLPMLCMLAQVCSSLSLSHHRPMLFDIDDSRGYHAAMLLLRTPKNTTPMIQYLGVSTAYISAMFFSNYSLQYISYPTQVLAKSCKPLPGTTTCWVGLDYQQAGFVADVCVGTCAVMLMQIVLVGKSYSASKYLLVFLLCAGIVMFVFNPVCQKCSQQRNASMWY